MPGREVPRAGGVTSAGHSDPSQATVGNGPGAEQHLPDAAQYLPVMIDAFDTAGRIVAWNHECERVTGYTAQEIVGNPRALELLYPDAEYREHMLAAWATRRTGRREWEWTLTCKDGTQRVIAWSDVATHGTPNSGVHWSVGIDVTKRRHAIASLEESEQRYRELLDRMNAAVAVYRVVDDGQDFIVADFNRLAETVEGVRKQDIVGRRVTEVFPGVEAFGLLDVFRRVWRSGRPEHHPISLYKDDRMCGWRDNHVFRLESGEVVAVYSDVTEQQHLKEERGQIFELLTDLFGVVDAEGRLCDVNAAWTKALGYEPSELVGRRLVDIVHPDDRQGVEAALHALAAGHAAGEFESRCTAKDGSVRAFSWMGTPPTAEGLTYCVGRDATERQRAEEALRAARRRWEDIFHAIGQPAVILDADQSVVAANDMVAKALGQPPETLLGKKCWELFHEPGAAGPPERCPFEAMQTSGGFQTVEMEQEALGGVYLVSCTPLVDESGQLTRAIHIATDITARKRAELALQESERTLATLMSNLPGMAYRCRNDRDWTMEFVSEGCLELTGYAADKLMENRRIAYAHVIHPDDRERVWQSVQSALDARRPFESVYRIITASGKEKSVWEKGQGVFDADGRLRTLEGFVTDITTQMQTEEALRESEQRLSLALRGGELGTWDWNVQTGAVVFNARWAEMLGYRLGEIEPHARAWERLLHPDDQPAVQVALTAHLEGRTEMYETEHRLRHKAGHWVWVLDKGRVIERDGDGRALRAAGTHLDITERKRAEEVLHKRIAALTQPLDDAAAISFADLFDVDEIQRIQDAFAESTGVASIITHPDGTPITRPSRFCRLCIDIIRKTKKGLHNCYCSDAMIGRHNPGGPIVQPCLSGGLWDAGASITVGGKHVANWLIGQVKNEAQDEAQMLRYAHDIGADPAEFQRALADVPVMSEDQFRKVAHTLFLLANELSTKAYQNVQQARYIAERKEAERALRESSGRLTLALHAAGMGTWEWDVTNNKVTWSRETEQIFGLQPGTFGGTYEAYLAFAAPERRAEVDANVRRFLEDSESSGEIQYQHRIIRADQREAWVEVRGTLFRDEHGRPARMTGICTDITASVQGEQKRRDLEDQLRQAQKMEAVGQLAGGVAHDFNNILTAIFGNVELALGELEEFLPANSRSVEGLRQIEQSAERAAALTRQLLAFSRRQILQPEVLDLNNTIANLQKMLRRLITENIELQVIPGDNLQYVQADPGQLEQVIINLAVNARDAMPDGGRLTIETANVILDEDYITLHAEARPGPHVLLAVSDTGHGMDAATKARIFEPFFTTKGAGEGTGLGLATVYGIIKQAGGHIMAYSEPGQGTTFRVYIPTCNVEGIATTAPAVSAQSPTGTETILVCEDDSAVRVLTANMLSGAGYRVLIANGAAEAQRLAQGESGPIDLLVTDVIMPGMNGKALSATLQAVRPELRTLFVSGYTANVIAHHGVLDAGVDFLEKPFSRDKLLRRVRDVLDHKTAAGVDDGVETRVDAGRSSSG